MPNPTSAHRSLRLWRTLGLISSMLVVSACSDSRSSVAPEAPQFSAAASCVPTAPIQTLIDALFPSGGVRNAATSQFSNIARQVCAGATADAQAKVFALVEFAITRYNNGQVIQPGTYSTALTLYNLISKLYEFVSLDFSTSGISATELQRAAWDGAVGIAQPGVPFTIKASSGDFASTTDANFFVKTALVVVEREPDNGPFQGIYTEWPPRYRVLVVPKDAQANYGIPANSSSPRAYTAVCPGDFNNVSHPAVSTLRVLRVPDPADIKARPAELLPLSSVALPLLNCTPKADAPPSQIGATQPRGTEQQLARVGLAAMARLGALMTSYLTPPNLYAWDGGVGGNNFEYSGFVAADPNSTTLGPVNISGSVRTVTGAPAFGASVCIQQSNFCTSVNSDAYYSLDLPADSGLQGTRQTLVARLQTATGSAVIFIPSSGPVTQNLIVQIAP